MSLQRIYQEANGMLGWAVRLNWRRALWFSLLSKATTKPTARHLSAVKTAIHGLKTHREPLVFHGLKGRELHLAGCSDAMWNRPKYEGRQGDMMMLNDESWDLERDGPKNVISWDLSKDKSKHSSSSIDMSDGSFRTREEEAQFACSKEVESGLGKGGHSGFYRRTVKMEEGCEGEDGSRNIVDFLPRARESPTFSIKQEEGIKQEDGEFQRSSFVRAAAAFDSVVSAPVFDLVRKTDTERENVKKRRKDTTPLFVSSEAGGCEPGVEEGRIDSGKEEKRTREYAFEGETGSQMRISKGGMHAGEVILSSHPARLSSHAWAPPPSVSLREARGVPNRWEGEQRLPPKITGDANSVGMEWVVISARNAKDKTAACMGGDALVAKSAGARDFVSTGAIAFIVKIVGAREFVSMGAIALIVKIVEVREFVSIGAIALIVKILEAREFVSMGVIALLVKIVEAREFVSKVDPSETVETANLKTSVCTGVIVHLSKTV
uniref:Uncharacterized protein n=1 Tax=Chromera velia CCMP2878 TaxID=1169474 RepID=A0A0G4FRN2_9ALVE|eukprot:Cvel_18424.t1-p1 / transcript=Cvel_18424.t1 / gene=Cvel_18424 / organism=Chromera_velia_CCMP2878 / gene_product=hypothetical protein / transcript_product=hypothetical protein / location=Cvel_scaffold1525:1342-7284(+) / protein_length=492 / sequence_SO=supercontig / SO=protein_coding / is_pseudo=false